MNLSQEQLAASFETTQQEANVCIDTFAIR